MTILKTDRFIHAYLLAGEQVMPSRIFNECGPPMKAAQEPPARSVPAGFRRSAPKYDPGLMAASRLLCSVAIEQRATFLQEWDREMLYGTLNELVVTRLVFNSR